MTPRFGRCPLHVGTSPVGRFVSTYWTTRPGNVLLLGGAGFDPRTLDIPRVLASPLQGRLHGVFLKEERPDADILLHALADGNEAQLRAACTTARVETVEVFAADGAVTGGRRAAALALKVPLAEYCDVIVDLSALSVGTAFPLVRTLLDALAISDSGCRLHLMVSASPGTDEGIQHSYGDHVETVHGFAGGWGLDDQAGSAKAWLPQLRLGRREVLARIHAKVTPHAVLPVIPFPSSDPKLGDKLLEQYQGYLEGTWEVDGRNIIVADERLPLDYYRTVLSVARIRKETFGESPGSVVVLTPMGSKVLALGALLAAVELNLPVMYVETRSFGTPASPGTIAPEPLHIWVHPTPPAR